MEPDVPQMTAMMSDYGITHQPEVQIPGELAAASSKTGSLTVQRNS